MGETLSMLGWEIFGGMFWSCRCTHSMHGSLKNSVYQIGLGWSCSWVCPLVPYQQWVGAYLYFFKEMSHYRGHRYVCVRGGGGWHWYKVFNPKVSTALHTCVLLSGSCHQCLGLQNTYSTISQSISFPHPLGPFPGVSWLAHVQE